jgi:cytochrome P450
MTSIEQALAAWGAYDRDEPFPLFAQVRALGPVHAVTLADGHSAWLVVGYDEARTALSHPKLSKDMHAALAASSEVVAEGLPGPDFARHMLVVDPPDHTRLRRLVATAFTAQRVEALRPHVQAIIDDLLDGIAAQPPDTPIDLVASLAFPLPYTVICELLGVPEADRAALREGLRALLRPWATSDQYALAKAGSDTVVRMLAELVDAKQQRPGDDLVSALLQACDGDERLTQQELLSTLFQLIVAGHDTTTSLIGNGVVALLCHPEQLALLRAEPDRLPAAVEEVLRYDAPVPHSTFRYATETVSMGGSLIPAGAQVIISLAAANRDDARYASPDIFVIDRPYARHLAFGHGIHFCLGAALARMEGQLAFGSLLRRFPLVRLAGDTDGLHWDHGDGLVLRGLSALWVIPGPSEGRDIGGDSEEGTRAMPRKVVDCRDFPSETGCTLTITGTEMEVIQAAAEHAASTHGHVDGPELREQLRSMMKDEVTSS